MEKIIDENGTEHLISENEVNRGVLLDRLAFYAGKESDANEKELLEDLAKWIKSVKFA